MSKVRHACQRRCEVTKGRETKHYFWSGLRGCAAVYMHKLSKQRTWKKTFGKVHLHVHNVPHHTPMSKFRASLLREHWKSISDP